MEFDSLSLLLLGSGLWAGFQNTLAGGGSFITLPALIMAGLSPLDANITSCVALFPMQVTTGFAGRKLITGVGRMPFWGLFLLSALGGALGALLLLWTPSKIFTAMVPYLVLFATVVFTWGSFFRKPSAQHRPVGPFLAGWNQFLIAIYGGYFGGGIGFLMMAALTVAGLGPRHAGATKNALAAVMNASAVLLFLTSPRLHWFEAIALGGGGVLGGLLGTWALYRIPERFLRISIVVIGLLLTVGLFLYHPGE